MSATSDQVLRHLYDATTISVVALAAVVVLAAYYTRASMRPRSFPPGPSTLPVIGNLHALPSSKMFLKFHEWTSTYGSIIGLKMGPTNVVVLNDYKHVRELLDKRGSIYSSRPPNHIATDIIYPNDTHVLYIPEGPGWKKQRKFLQGVLTVKSVDNMLPLQEAQASFTLHDFLRDGNGYYDHMRRYTTGVILSCVFGLHVSSFNSKRLQDIYHQLEEVTAILEIGATPPIDAFPFLKYLPDFMASWRDKAKRIRTGQQKVYAEMIQLVKDQISENCGHGSFMENIVREQEKEKTFSDEYLNYLGGVLIEASSDTTASTLLSFVTAMALHPHVLKKCQAETEAVCGTERSPTSQDLGKLPYIRACMLEILRWRPVAAGGIPHLLTQDDVYGEYRLPKGTVVLANAWSIHRTSDFEDPDSFVPERFLNNKFGTNDTADITDDKRRVLYGFGAGRRVCTGQRMAENTLLTMMAKMTWAFDIGPSYEGAKIDGSVETGYLDGFLITPRPSPVRCVPRSNVHKDVILQEFVEVEKLFSTFKE